MYYRYSRKWIGLYELEPLMVKTETGHYIKGMHNLLNAHFVLRNYSAFHKTLEQFVQFSKTERAQQHDNFRVHTSIYINSAKLNGHLMMGTFKEGIALIPSIEEKLNEYALYVDGHRILVFNYKMATLYYGAGQYEKAIDYLQKIINWKVDLRTDLQCYARLLHLIAHYELGNFELLEFLFKSVYRFMAKMENLTVIEEEMFRFLKNSFGISPRHLKPEFEKFLYNIKHLETNRFETRSFAYLDTISWLESKLQGVTMGEVIHRKYQQSKRSAQKQAAPAKTKGQPSSKAKKKAP